MSLENNNFLNFLNTNHILATVVATVISTYITGICNSLTNDILIPIINIDLDGDGKNDIQQIQNFKIKIMNVEIGLGNFILELVKFIFITYLMYLFSNNFNINKYKT